MSATKTLTGARWSSAVRCVAKASHEGIGSPRDEDATHHLERFFRRGVNVGKAWALGKHAELTAEGHEVILEAEVPWGIGWTGHVDLIDLTTKTAYETYHAAKGEFREVKALQIAGYCDELEGDWTAELAVVDTTDVEDDSGFAVQPYEISVPGLRERVRDIKRRVIANVQAGEVDPADRVSDTPHHSECRSCVFAAICHANYRPPEPESVPGLEDSFEALRITESDLHHAAAKVEEITARRDSLRDAIRPFTQVGVPVVSGGTLVKRSEVAGRVTFKLGDATKAGHQMPDTLAAFIKQGEPSERWKVEAAQ